MLNSTLEQTMQTEWEQVRKRFYYPQLPHPNLVDNIPNGSINMENLEIKVSQQFISNLKVEHGIEEPSSLNEVLSHEVTHFMKYPGSVLNILRLQKAAREEVNEAKASQLREAFTEAQTNIYLVNDFHHPDTVRMRAAIQPDKKDEFGRLMYGLYQEAWNKDIGIKLGKKQKKLVEELRQIDYTDKDNEIDNLRRFVRILKDYKIKEQSQGTGQGNSLDKFTGNQIREGIRQFAKECSSPKEFEQIVQEVLEGKDSKKEKSLGKLAGTDKGITELARNHYTALAEKYQIPIRKKPLHKNGSLYPYSHDSFSIGDSINDLDPFSTPGILPGITKKWIRREGEVYTSSEAVPDNVLIIDNSPSMFDSKGDEVITPDDKIYLHIIGATAVSNSYLDNNAKVAVYSFGSKDHFTSFTRDKEEIHRELRRFSKKGGTTFNTEFLESTLRQNEGGFDVSVISDMEISNLDAFVSAVLNIPRTHRIHLLYTENNSRVDDLKGKFGAKENIALLPLIYEKDIHDIVMGELKKSVY